MFVLIVVFNFVVIFIWVAVFVNCVNEVLIVES